MSDNQGLTAVPDNLQKLANSLDKARREILEGPSDVWSSLGRFVYWAEDIVEQGNREPAQADYDRDVQEFVRFVHGIEEGKPAGRGGLPGQIAERLDARYQTVASSAASYAAADAGASDVAGSAPV